jgi:hypothetical protein
MYFKNLFEKAKAWISQRIEERTTWDGVILVVAGITYLIFKPLAVLVAYAAIVYGVWTIWKSER